MSKKKLAIVLIVALLLIIGGIAVGIASWFEAESPSASQAETLDIHPDA